MRLFKTSAHCFHVTLFAALLLGPAAASAASQCKGVQQDTCASMPECVWVDGYVRKDGRSVSSHCKAKARRKPADQAASGSVRLSHVK